MGIPIFQVDAFTEEPFKGNPAGVCLLKAPAEASWMQSVAAEMNLSETAFPLPEGDGFRLRWFTPRVEVKLCGHATLATAHILWETGILAQSQEARFQTLSGLLTARRDGEWIELNFPSRPIQPGLPDWIDALVGAVGVKPSFIGMSAEDVLIQVADEGTRLVARARFRDDPGPPGPRRHRHQPVGRRAFRLRLPLLRPGRRRRRGPGDGLVPLRPDAVLGAKAGQGLDDRATRPRRAAGSSGCALTMTGSGSPAGR